jgi:hypothetical protein
MSLNIKNILATLLIISGLLVVTGCNGDSGVNGLLLKPDYVDNTPIFPEYQYPNAGGAKQEYLAKLCNNNADIWLVGQAGELLPTLNSPLNIHSFKVSSIDNNSCTGYNSPGPDICKSEFIKSNSLIISVEDLLNHINPNLFAQYFKHDVKFMVCGIAKNLGDQYWINFLTQIQPKNLNGFLALDAQNYVVETKLAHFKKFAELVHNNAVNSPNYEQFNAKCNLLKDWNADKLTYQKIDITACRPFLIGYSKYTTYSGFSPSIYDSLSNNTTVLDMIEKAFTKTQYDPDYFVVSA